MTKGIFYSVGVGPGDPELLTLKAVHTIKNADVIAVPHGGVPSMALDIAKEYTEGKPLLHCHMPMTLDQDVLEAAHQKASAEIGAKLDEGLSVAFLAVGDPTIYSTAMYVHQRLNALGYDTRVISGITSFCAAAAALSAPLCEGGQALHVLPGTVSEDQADTIVLMKSGQKLTEALIPWREQGAKISLVEWASTPDERICQEPDTMGYFSIAVIKPIPEKKEPGLRQFFPLFIPFTEQKVLVVGGGNVATRRVQSLCQFACAVTVVAPRITEELAALHEDGRIEWQERVFADSDLEGYFMAVAATDNRQVNKRIGQLARGRGQWVSVADCREECNFYFPAIVLGKDIVGGLISEGRSPHAAAIAAQQVRGILR